MEIDSDPVKAIDNKILSTKLYDKLEPVLQNINRNFVHIDDNVKRRNVECFKTCTEDFIRRMKEVNQTFRDLFQEVRYTGSYFEGSRVKEPNEFDINLVLHQPFDIAIYEDSYTYPGYVHLLVAQPNIQTCQNGNQSAWVENGVMKAQLVICWLEGVVSSVFQKAGAAGQSIIVNNKFSVRVLTKSGPAITLRMQEINASNRAELIDVDFVPVFEFQHPIWPKKTRMMPASCSKTTKWSVTPKVEYNPSEWRLSFAFLEKEMLHDKPNLKNIYRLIKRLRDSSVNLKRLKSYHIKTLFLWKVHQLNTNEWKKSLGRLFVMLLFELENCLARGERPFFWDRRMNMIGNLSQSLVTDMWRKIANIRENVCRLLNANDIPRLRKYMYSLFIDPSQGLDEMRGLNFQTQNLRRTRHLNLNYQTESHLVDCLLCHTFFTY